MNQNISQHNSQFSLEKLRADIAWLTQDHSKKYGRVSGERQVIHHESSKENKQQNNQQKNTNVLLKQPISKQNPQIEQKGAILGQFMNIQNSCEAQMICGKFSQNIPKNSSHQQSNLLASALLHKSRKEPQCYQILESSQSSLDQHFEKANTKHNQVLTRIIHDDRPIIVKANKPSSLDQQKKAIHKVQTQFQSQQRDKKSYQNQQPGNQHKLVQKIQYENMNKERISKKNPLQTSSVHPLIKMQMIPNITKLNFKLFFYDNKQNEAFENSEIQKLEKFDLDQVSAVTISTKEMTDEVFTLFTKLQWNNLRALRIDNNNIFDIRPLKNLNLRILQDLDISFNFLDTKSAEFLATQPFDELIYFTVSFNSGLDEKCWEIMLQNQMDNYPKLQKLDIGNSPYLSNETMKQIQGCMFRKMGEQRRKGLNKLKEEQEKCKDSSKREMKSSNYPQDYQIKIRWRDTREAYDTFTLEQIKSIEDEWIEEVQYKGKKLQRLNIGIRIKRNQLKRESKEVDNEKEQKSKPIKKTQLSLVDCWKKSMKRKRGRPFKNQPQNQ